MLRLVARYCPILENKIGDAEVALKAIALQYASDKDHNACGDRLKKGVNR
ncbi:hypothetical protein [Brasilonema bromeliae]|nr:hypothetical protein [Brasilonema bromeliae]